jgi:hypothetical protein
MLLKDRCHLRRHADLEGRRDTEQMGDSLFRSARLVHVQQALKPRSTMRRFDSSKGARAGFL